MNGGTCFNTGQGSYTCSCAPGFTGTDCEASLQDCDSKPCLNGGSCTENATLGIGKTGYQCSCSPGWRGRHCEVTSKSCRDAPCLHGATCEEHSLKGYLCLCPAGYSGTDCETQIDDCSPNPCMNGGACTDRLNGYQCSCPFGFVGDRCETNIDDCQGDPCLNGGKCIDLINKFRCQCVPGYVGRLCQNKVDYCFTKPCANGGKCTSGTNDYACICKPGFSGKDCSVDVDECRSAPCQNGGSCQNRVNGFVCLCVDGWRGESCAEEIGAPSAVPSGPSYWTGNISKSPEARDAGLTTEHVVVIATLSTAVPAFVLVAAVAVMCMKRRQKREQAKADEEARLQNERNAVHSSMSKRSGGSCSLGGGDPHMIKNTWGAANKSVNNVTRDDLDSSFQTDNCTIDSSCSGGGYKPEPVIQDCRSRTTKQLNIDAAAAAHRASHLFKEKDILEAKRTSMFAESCCADPSIIKRPTPAITDSTGVDQAGAGGVYVIDDHYRHDAALAATLATEV